jgi:hypothetical protein
MDNEAAPRSSTHMTKATPPPPFDRMRRDRANGGHVATLVHGSRKIRFRILAESINEFQTLLPTAQKFWRARSRWFKAFRDYAVDELCPI